MTVSIDENEIVCNEEHGHEYDVFPLGGGRCTEQHLTHKSPRYLRILLNNSVFQDLQA